MVGIDAADLIPHILKHHFDIGVDRVFYIDNGSTDESLDILLSYPNVHVWSQPEQFSSRNKTDWTMQLVSEYGPGCWCLIVDTDEMFIYPNYETTPIQDFVALQEQLGFDCVATRFIDMYANTSVQEARVTDSLLDALPYFDVSDYGCRDRALGFRPAIGKMPLFRYNDEITPTLCFHAIHGFEKLSDTYCGLLHFKFHADYKNTFLRHVHKMTDSEKKIAIYGDLEEHNFYDEQHSVRYTGSHDLELFSELWQSEVWQEHLRRFRRQRDFSHTISSIKALDDSRGTCFVIVGCYNEFALTKQLLDTLVVNQDDAYNYIYLFIDDASPETDTLEYFQKRIHEIDLNIVFARHIRNRKLTAIWNYGVNYGVMNYNARYVLFLNNDIMVSPGWSRKMIEFAASQNDECAVGPITNHCNTRGGRQILSSYIAGREDIDKRDIPQVCEEVADLPAARLEDGDFLSGFCLLLPTRVLAEGDFERDDGYLHYFDPDRRHYGNEMEFFARFKYPLYVLPSVFVYHEGEASIRSFRSRFGFFYQPDGSINRSLVMLVIKHFWAENNEQEQASRLAELRRYLDINPCEEVWQLVQQRSAELDADVRIVRRQIRFEDEALAQTK